MSKRGKKQKLTLTSRDVILNPLRVFPSKSQTISKALFSDDNKRWLDPSYIDPDFGIQVH